MRFPICKVSDTYFDKYQFEARPELLLNIARYMARLVPPGTEALAAAGLPLKALFTFSEIVGA